MLCYAMLCYAMLCYAMLCYHISFGGFSRGRRLRVSSLAPNNLIRCPVLFLCRRPQIIIYLNSAFGRNKPSVQYASNSNWRISELGIPGNFAGQRCCDSIHRPPVQKPQRCRGQGHGAACSHACQCIRRQAILHFGWSWDHSREGGGLLFFTVLR